MTLKEYLKQNYPVTAKDLDKGIATNLNDIEYICTKWHESEVKKLHLQNVVCSALSDEVATKILAHCPYEKSGWCTTEIGCRFKLENCDAKGNGCELAL